MPSSFQERNFDLEKMVTQHFHIGDVRTGKCWLVTDGGFTSVCEQRLSLCHMDATCNLCHLKCDLENSRWLLSLHRGRGIRKTMCKCEPSMK